MNKATDAAIGWTAFGIGAIGILLLWIAVISGLIDVLS